MARHRSNKKGYVLVAIILLIVVIAAAFAISQPKSKKPSASQYFIVTHTSSLGTFAEDNKSVNLQTLGLNVTAVGGDATNVQLQCKSQAYALDDYIQTLSKGPPGWDVQIALKGGDYNEPGLYVRLDPQGMFEVNITVSCSETESAVFKVLINPQDVAGV